jgi:DNA-binding transcriptional regulator YiaG
MPHEPAEIPLVVKKSPRPFPRYCDRDRKKTVLPATITYRTSLRHDDVLHTLEVPDLVVPRCTECGELYFDNDTEEQISRAFRSLLRLLHPEQIRNSRETLQLSTLELASRLGIEEQLLRSWEEGLMIQSRAMDNLLRLYFALPEARSLLDGGIQHADVGAVVVA